MTCRTGKCFARASRRSSETQLGLRLEHAVDWDRGDRLAGRSDTKLVGKTPANPSGRIGRTDMMRSPALENSTTEKSLGTTASACVGVLIWLNPPRDF